MAKLLPRCWRKGVHRDEYGSGALAIPLPTNTRPLKNLRQLCHPMLKVTVAELFAVRDGAASCGVNIAGAVQILTGDSSQEWNARIHRKYLNEGALTDSRVTKPT